METSSLMNAATPRQNRRKDFIAPHCVIFANAKKALRALFFQDMQRFSGSS
jgi:hypothetical protein